MTLLKSNPFIRLLIPLVIGILIQNILPINEWLLIGVCFLTLIPEFIYIKQKQNFSTQWKFGVGVFLFVFLGALLLSSRGRSDNSVFYTNHKQFIQATTIGIPKETDKAYGMLLHVDAFKLKNTWVAQDYQMQTYFEKDSLVKNIKAGQRIVLKTNIGTIGKNLNPFGFDFARYMSFNQVNHSAFVKSDDWILLEDEVNGLKALALNYRQKILHIYEKAGLGGEELAVFSALTVGYKDKLESQIRDAYAGAGAMHILAVSGMHVAIIFMILSFLLKPISLIKPKSKLVPLFIVLGIWIYAFTTGLSPSITRASTMATFILLGKIVGKRMNIYNSLAAAAFIMLCYNPNYLYQVGFQLSFLAVISIVVCYKKIYGFLYVKNYILNKIWQLSAVAFAAQLGTFPLGIYYFGQLPFYFWLSGAIVVVAAQLLMGMSMLLLVLASVNLPLSWIADAIHYTTWFLNKIVYLINELPIAVLEFQNVSLLQVGLLFVFVISLWFWVESKKFRGIFTALSCLVILMGIHSYYHFVSKKNQTLAVYHAPRETAIQLMDDGNSLWILSDTSNVRLKQLQKDAANYWHLSGKEDVIIACKSDSLINHRSLRKKQNFFQIGEFVGYVLDNKAKLPYKVLQKISIDFLIVTQNSSYALNEVNKVFVYDTIIVDASVPEWKYKRWSGKESKPKFITQSGAFIQTFSN